MKTIHLIYLIATLLFVGCSRNESSAEVFASAERFKNILVEQLQQKGAKEVAESVTDGNKSAVSIRNSYQLEETSKWSAFRRALDSIGVGNGRQTIQIPTFMIAVCGRLKFDIPIIL